MATFDDNVLVRHGRHVRTACRAGAHDDGDLGDAHGRHISLVVENAPEVLLIREHLILQWQECSATINKVHAWKSVLSCNLLCTQMLFDSDRVVSATLHSCIIGDDHTVYTINSANSSNNSSRRHISIHLMTSESTQFKERSSGINQTIDSFPCQKFSSCFVTQFRLFSSSFVDFDKSSLVIVNDSTHADFVQIEIFVFWQLAVKNSAPR